MEPLLQKTPSTNLAQPQSHLLDYYRIIRGQIEHEDNLVGSRISWFVTSQSFLFSAYAILANGIQPNTSRTGLDAKHVILVVLPLLAITASILILISILSGLEAMRRLRQRYAALAPSDEQIILPPIQGARLTRITGMASPVLLPPLFMGVWIFLLARHLF